MSRSDAADRLSEASQNASARPDSKARDQARAAVANLINVADKEGRTLLHREAAAGRSNTVETLLSWGADVGKLDNAGQSPLATVLCSGSANTLSVLQHLQAAGANLHAHDIHGTPMLSLALQYAPADAVAFLLKNQGGLTNPVLADLCTQWLKAYHATPNALAIAKLFLAQGLDAQKCCNADGSNLFIATAICAGNVNFLRQVLAVLPQSDPAVVAQLERHVLSFVGKSSWTDKQISLLKVALRNGLNPRLYVQDSRFWGGSTGELISAVAMRGDLELIKLLVEAKVPFDNGDSDGITPLGYAALRRDRPTYDYLLEHGAQDRTHAFCRSHWESPPTPQH